MKKFNYKTGEYEDYDVPAEWNVLTCSDNLRAKINCADCGAELEYGDSYTSLSIRTDVGFGYCVCKECYNREWRDRTNAKREEDKRE
ncbi:MAG: hypothetical protein GX671_08080 [Clostridiales bacterium]|nr:hypothetical protein [Clostridiales bacterium]